MAALTPNSVAKAASYSKTVTDTIVGEHQHVIVGYSLVKGIGDGEPIASERFTVGGHEWVSARAHARPACLPVRWRTRAAAGARQCTRSTSREMSQMHKRAVLSLHPGYVRSMNAAAHWPA